MKRESAVPRMVLPLAAGAVLLAGAGALALRRPPAAAAPQPVRAQVSPVELEARAYEQAELAARMRPKDAHLALEAGARAGDMGRSREALAWFRKAAELDPKLLPAITGQGQMWMALGRPGLAAAQFEKALKSAPDEPQLLLELARAYAELREFGEAFRYAQRAEKLPGTGAEAQRALANIHADALNADASLAAIRRACELEPDNVENWVTQGGLRLRNSDYGEAEASLRRALEMEPGHEAANILLARVLLERDKTPEADRQAFALLARARLDNPQAAEALRLQGEILVRAGEFPLAISLLRQARETSPLDSRILLALGQALVRNGKSEEGVRIISESQKLGPRGVAFLDLENLARTDSSPAVALRLARLYRRQGRHDAAIHVLQRALRRTPGVGELQTELQSVRQEADGATGGM